jgi:hypothetical protein
MRGAVIGTLLWALGWPLAASAAETLPAVAEPETKAATQITINVKVMKLSRSKMRDAGIDFTEITLLGKQVDRQDFASFLLLLKRNNLVRTEIEPTLVTTDGRQTYFHSGPTVAGRKTGPQLQLTPTQQARAASTAICTPSRPKSIRPCRCTNGGR